MLLHQHARPAVAGSYLLGAITGALLSAAGLVIAAGLFSVFAPWLRSCIALVALAVLVVKWSGLIEVALPYRRYQIPREVFLKDPRLAAFRFAFELGLGFRTYITSPAPYGLFVVVLLSANGPYSVLAALCGAIGFGFGRSIVVASQALMRTVPIDHPKPAMHWAALVSLIASAIYVLSFFNPFANLIG